MRHFWQIATIAIVLSILSASAADIWLNERIPVFGAFAGLQYSLNPGIAFGIRLPAGIQEVLIAAALGLVYYLARTTAKNQLSQLAFGMIVGGGIGNIVDRLRDGFVTDYFQIGSFPIFNVADSFVSVGVALLLLDALLQKKY